MRKEILISIDLELNQPSGSIIQIGAVAGNIVTGEIVDRFTTFVNPGEKLGDCREGMSITDLTGIEQDDVDSACDIYDAYAYLKEFVDKNQAFINPITWGGGDSECLRNELLKYNADYFKSIDWIFGRRWIDAKTLYISWRLANGKDPVGGLGKALTRVGLKFNGRKHNALHDAENTFIIYKRMLDLFKKEEI